MGGQIARQYLPFSAAPQFAPQGFFGDLVGALAPVAGTVLGGPAGGAIGGVGGQLARQYIPFGAAPQFYQGWGHA